MTHVPEKWETFDGAKTDAKLEYAMWHAKRTHEIFKDTPDCIAISNADSTEHRVEFDSRLEVDEFITRLQVARDQLFPIVSPNDPPPFRPGIFTISDAFVREMIIEDVPYHVGSFTMTVRPLIAMTGEQRLIGFQWDTREEQAGRITVKDRGNDQPT